MRENSIRVRHKRRYKVTRTRHMMMALNLLNRGFAPEVFYNQKRRHSTLGYKLPMQFLDDWFIAQQYGKLVA